MLYFFQLILGQFPLSFLCNPQLNFPLRLWDDPCPYLLAIWHPGEDDPPTFSFSCTIVTFNSLPGTLEEVPQRIPAVDEKGQLLEEHRRRENPHVRCGTLNSSDEELTVKGTFLVSDDLWKGFECLTKVEPSNVFSWDVVQLSKEAFH